MLFIFIAYASEILQDDTEILLNMFHFLEVCIKILLVHFKLNTFFIIFKSHL